MSEQSSQRQNLRAAYRFAVATCCCTVLLLMAGALVTSNNAADSVPDWPLAYGKLVPPWVGGVRFEYTHRVLAAIVSLLTLVLAVWLARSERRPVARRLGWTALGLVMAQAALGGVRVLVGHPALSATAHAILAQVFFLTMVGLSLYLSPWWERDLPRFEDLSSPTARSLSLWTTLAILGQLVLGAAFRHGAFGIAPHLVGAGVVTVLVVITGRVVKHKFPQRREIRRGVALLHSFFGLQLLLGAAAYWAVLRNSGDFPTANYVLATVAHVLGGALTLAASVLLTLSCFRLTDRTSFAATNSTGARFAGRTTAG